MLLSPQSFQRLLTQGTSKLAWFSGVLLMGVSAGIFSHATPTLAAERVIFRYGILQESFSVKDMQTFAETGELSRLRRFQLRVAGVDPEVVREFLNQKLRVNFLTLDRVLNSLPGEFLLYQMGQVVYNRRRVAPIQSLRAALVLSAREDNYVTLLKFLQNYPLQEVFVDGKKIAAVGQRVGNTRARVESYLETVTAVVEQILDVPLCACDSEAGTTQEP
ncbi:MAG: alpha/beta hydrolase [Chroococcidiopsidaceae cyanobacterium CP_BM_RX_35]|nr:alpha/beta hydrolase [Chroococcidiopsidaceae cyanobacterium CP_BM_RX_35]